MMNAKTIGENYWLVFGFHFCYLRSSISQAIVLLLPGERKVRTAKGNTPVKRRGPRIAGTDSATENNHLSFP
jgi:hypothetical protein